MDKLCYRCLQNAMENGRCKACHSPAVPPREANQTHALPLGTLLDDGNIIVGDKLGGGGFGITYIARDKSYGLIALKEFFPNSCVSRQGLDVVPYADRQKYFDSGKRDFQREVRHILRLKDHPHIVDVLFELEENNTCYYGMELLQGQSMLQYLQRNGKMTPVDAFVLLEPVMDALTFMHGKGCLHRDIAPDNIYLRNDDRMPMKLSPCIIDFGAAFTDRDSFTYVAPNVGKPGFSPPDQKYEVDKQGPFTDVYALCATYYYMITGKVPLSSDSRIIQPDAKLMPPSHHVPGISPAIDQIIMHGMELDTTKRIQTVAEVRSRLRQELIDPPKPAPVKPKPRTEHSTAAFSVVNTVKPGPAQAADTPVKSGSGSQRILSLVSCLIEWLAFFGVAALMAPGQIPSILIIGYLLSLVLNVASMQLLGSATFGQKLLGLWMEGTSQREPIWAQLCYNIFRSLVPIQLLAELVSLLSPGRVPFTEGMSGLVTRFTPQAGSTPIPGQDPLNGLSPESIQIPVTPSQGGHSSGYQLRCISGNMTGHVIPLENGCALGRTATPPYRIDGDLAVSQRHCTFHYRDGVWYLRDEKSHNGTYVNQKRAEAGQYIPTKPGDIISIGHERFVFQTSKER